MFAMLSIEAVQIDGRERKSPICVVWGEEENMIGPAVTQADDIMRFGHKHIRSKSSI